MNRLKFGAIPSLKLKPYSITNKGGETLYVEEARLVRLVSESFRVPYEIRIPSDIAYGIKLRNGTWTGMMGMLGRTEVDLAVGCIGIHSETPPGVHFVYPHFLSEDTFMGNKPEPLTAKEAIVYPFSYEMWIMTLLCLVVVTLLLYHLMNRKRAMLDILFILFGSCLEKSLDFKIHKRSVRVVVVTWIIAIFVLSSSYKGVLLSFLTFPTLVGIRDILDLSRASIKNSVICCTYRGTPKAQRLIEPKFDTWTAVGEILMRNEMTGVLKNSTMEQIFLHATRKKVFLTGKTFLNPYEKLYFISKDSFQVVMFFIYYSKTFCCPKRLNKLIFRLTAAGLIEKYRRDETFFAERSAIVQFPESNLSETLKTIRFSDFSGVFILLLSGWILGFITLLAELIVNKISFLKKNRSKSRTADGPTPGVTIHNRFVGTISYHR